MNTNYERIYRNKTNMKDSTLSQDYNRFLVDIKNQIKMIDKEFKESLPSIKVKQVRLVWI